MDLKGDISEFEKSSIIIFLLSVIRIQQIIVQLSNSLDKSKNMAIWDWIVNVAGLAMT